MKVYVAAPYGAREQVRRYCEELALSGYVPTSTWAFGSRQVAASTVHTAPALSDEEVDRYSSGDLADIRRSDVLVLLTESAVKLAAGGAHSGGRHVELGYALGLPACSVIVVGEPENIFHRSPLVTRVDYWDDVLRLLKSYQVWRIDSTPPPAA